MNRTHGMSPCWAPALMWFCLALLAACSRESANQPPAALPPLVGAYRAAEGSVVEFLPDGRFRSSGAVGGQFSVDGDRVELTVENGRVVRGQRQGPDVVALDGPKGPQKLFRVGSAAAQTSEATTPPPSLAPAPEAAVLKPDRGVPLGDYTRLESPSDVALLAAAFAEPPLSDEAKLQLVPGEPTDAFARKEWAARELPALDARINVLKRSRYIRVSVSSLMASASPKPDPGYALAWVLSSMSQVDGREPLQPYDHGSKGFGISCLNKTGLLSQIGGPSIRFGFGEPERGCSLPIEDDTLARKVEAARAKFGRFYLRADVYAFVTGTSPGSVDVVPVHFDVSVVDPADATNQTVLAVIPVDL